jgi:hypothetical protein
LNQIISLGWTGAEVAKIQRACAAAGTYTMAWLKAHGFPALDHEPKLDNKFGAMTEAAVKGYQQLHQLLDDGQVGQFTWAIMFPGDDDHAQQMLESIPQHPAGTAAELRELAVQFAITQIGVRERPHNRGAVEKYMTCLGFTYSKDQSVDGPPYCKGFEYWNFLQAANKMGVKNPAIPTAHVMTSYREELKRGWILPNKVDAARGDSMRLRFDGDTGHAGIICGRASVPGKVTTVEGNTSSNDLTVAQTRDGNEGVLQKPRVLLNMYAVARIGG